MTCSHFKFTLEENHRYYVDSLENNNCVFCLIDKNGPMTQEDIAKIMGLTKVRIGQIEFSALKKFKKYMNNHKRRYDSL